MGTRFLLLASLVCLLFCASCSTTNKIAYLQHAKESYKNSLTVVDAPFQKNDILTITISSANAQASADFNKGEIGANKGYLINNDGNVELPMLGDVKAAGLTKKQLKDNITNTILKKKLLVDPLVEIRYINFEITVLGEVGKPSVINIPSEQVTLLKALSLAGDLTIYGKRDNILLIREEGGVRKTKHIDLTSADFLNSEYYYLKPNDLLYVEPNKTKIAVSGRSQQTIPLIFSSLTILFFVFDKVIK